LIKIPSIIIALWGPDGRGRKHVENIVYMLFYDCIPLGVRWKGKTGAKIDNQLSSF